MREMTMEEIENVDGAVLPLMFVGAVALSQVSWTSVAFMAGTMTGIGIGGSVLYNAR
jgi:hypothetical protein